MSSPPQVFRKFNTKVWITRNSLENGVIQTVVVLEFDSRAEYVTFLGVETHTPRIWRKILRNTGLAVR